MKTLDVPLETIQALFVLIPVPESTKPGTYTGTITVEPENEDARDVTYTLTVTDTPPKDKYSDMYELRRLSWLNSKLGTEDTITAPYTPVDGFSVMSGMVTPGIIIDDIVAKASGVEKSVLTSPISFDLSLSDDSLVTWAQPTTTTPTGPDFSGTSSSWTSTTKANNAPLKLTTSATLNFDGYIFVSIELSAEDSVSLEKAAMNIPFEGDYMFGLNQHGGKTKSTEWTWADAVGTQTNLMWVGDATGGFRVQFLPTNDPGAIAPQWVIDADNLPESWAGVDGSGGISLDNREGVISAYSTSFPALNAGDTMTWELSIIITPVKPFDFQGLYENRYFQVRSCECEKRSDKH